MAQPQFSAFSADFGMYRNPANTERIPFSTRWQVRAELPADGREYPFWISAGRQTNIFSMQGHGRLTFLQTGITWKGPDMTNLPITTSFSLGAGPEWARFREKSDLTVQHPFRSRLNGIRLTGEFNLRYQPVRNIGLCFSLRAESTRYISAALYRTGLQLQPALGIIITK